MSKEAMKLALDALGHCKDVIIERGLNGNPEFAKKWGLLLPLERAEQAITALREALAEQPAQQEPVAYWIPKAEQFCIADPSGRPFAKAWKPLYTYPQPTQQKPTKAAELVDALIAKYSDKLFDSVGPHDAAKFEEDCNHIKQTLAPQPAQRQARSADTWVGLTHEEHMEIMTGTMTTSSRMAAVEAKLKERNQ